VAVITAATGEKQMTSIGTTIEPELTGFRGWLALLALGMVLSPLRVLSDTVKSGYTAADWDALAKFRGGTGLAYFENGMSWAYVCLVFGLSFLFFRKSRLFPKVFVFAWVTPLAIIVLDVVGMMLVFREYIPLATLMTNAFQDERTIKSLVAFAIGIPWVGYVLMSRRVKNTFVK
jgi:hypothetical protein